MDRDPFSAQVLFKLSPFHYLSFFFFSRCIILRLIEKRLLVKTVGGESKFIEEYSEVLGFN